MLNKEIFKPILVIIMLACFSGCSKEEPIRQGGTVTEPTIYFNSVQELATCMMSNGKYVSERYNVVDMDDYTCLMELKERGEIPVGLFQDSEYSLDYTKEQGGIEIIDRLKRLCYNGILYENSIKVQMFFLDEEDLSDGENTSVFAVYLNNKSLFPSTSEYRIEGENKKIGDRSVEVMIYDTLGGNEEHRCFVYNDMLIIISTTPELLTDDCLAKFSIEYIEIDYEIRNASKFLRNCNEIDAFEANTEISRTFEDAI